jgi:hypothetical protein
MSTSCTIAVCRRLGRVGEHDVGRVDPVLKAARRGDVEAERARLDLVLRVEAGEEAPVALVDLVAESGVMQEQGEVVEEVERVMGHVGVDGQPVIRPRDPVELCVEIRPLRDTALGGIDRPEAADQTLLHRAERDLA